MKRMDGGSDSKHGIHLRVFITIFFRGKNWYTNIRLWDSRFSAFNHIVVACGILHVNREDFSRFEDGLLLTKRMWTLDD
jgi:hypothetical protein